jgi:hypothetical protein
MGWEEIRRSRLWVERGMMEVEGGRGDLLKK